MPEGLRNIYGSNYVEGDRNGIPHLPSGPPPYLPAMRGHPRLQLCNVVDMPRLPGLVLGETMSDLAAISIICLLSVIANVGVLAITIKVYSEVLKIEHVKRIGKKDKTDPDAVVR